MSKDLEQRLHEALDAERVSDDLRQEVAGQAELESMIELDAALRTMPRAEFDFSDAVLARLDEDLDEIPGLLDAPQFDGEFTAPPETAAQAPQSKTPISLDDARRKRSAAPFLLAAAAVVGLVATSTLMTLNSPSSDSMALEAPAVSSAYPAAAPTTVGARQAESAAVGYADEEMAEAEMAEPAAAAPEEFVVAADEAPEAEADFDDSLGALAFSSETRTEGQARDSYERPAARSRLSRSASGGARGAPLDGAEDFDEELSASQQRTLARIESCLPDHIRITRVRESADGRRVVGVETSEPLSNPVDECVSGVLDSFPRARRRRRATSMSSMSSPARAITTIDD